MPERIVVGVDGSEQSRSALDRALAEARLRGAEVEVVHVWSAAVSFGPARQVTDEAARGALLAEARRTLEATLADLPDDGTIRSSVVEGPVVQTLLELARDADMIVLGTRGRGGFDGLAMGSTSHQVATHASCAVLLVPPTRT